MKRIAAGKLVFDKSVYPRTEVDADHVFGLHEAYKCGAELPPPIVCGTTLRIVDGVHRVNAWIRFRGADSPIEVAERFYKSDKDLFLDAIKANARHGRALTTDDRRRTAGIASKLQIDPDCLATELSISRAVIGGLAAASCSQPATMLRTASPLKASGVMSASRQRNSETRPADPLGDLKQAARSFRELLRQVNPSVAAGDKRMVELINRLHEDVDDFVRAVKKARPV